jgi:anaerobic dimethyl sulfoxide reductase subunit C (anchor subunit)
MNLREWALPLYTILMQLAVGALLVLWILRRMAASRFSEEAVDRILRNPLLIIWFTVAAAMVAAHAHLSRPLRSYLAIRNFGSSWLSREIVFTVVFFAILSGLLFFRRFRPERRGLITGLGWLGAGLGLTVVYCMASIYLLPTQLAWNSPSVIVSFYVTTLLLGTMTIACLLMLDLRFVEIQKADDLGMRAGMFRFAVRRLSVAALAVAAIDITVTFFLVYQLARGEALLQTSLRLLFELYGPLFVARLLLLGSAPLWLWYAVHRNQQPTYLPQGPQELVTPVFMACLLIFIAEIIGRFLFYATHIRVGI